MRFIAPGWCDIHGMLKELHEKVTEKALNPDIVVGIAMGGIVPAVILARLLRVEVDSVGAKFYRGVDERGERPQITQEVSSDLEGLSVLLVDDVADSGETLKAVKEHIQKRGVAELATCTLHYKPWSIIKPDIYIDQTEAWIIYPWERKEAFRDIKDKMRSEGLSKEEIRNQMIANGIPESLVDDMHKLQ